MKKLIILLFIGVSVFGQENNVLLQTDNLILKSGDLLSKFNTLDLGRVLDLRAKNISADSLTFNSTGQNVTWFNVDTVVIDGNSEVVRGNSVRFGSPTTGTIYKIQDTLSTADSMILDQTFSGLVTDEFLWGGINKWYDESGRGNHATQVTGINQPKLLWAGTGSAEVDFDGLNDYFEGSLISEICAIKELTVFVEFYSNSFGEAKAGQIFEHSNDANDRVMMGVESNRLEAGNYNGVDLTRNWGVAQTGKAIYINRITSDELYIDGVLQNEGTYAPSSAGLSKFTIGVVTNLNTAFFFDGNIKTIIFYNRILNENEINALSNEN